MVRAKIEVNEMDLMLLLGVARNQTLAEMRESLGVKKQISFVQYRLNRLETLGYVKSFAAKSRSRYLTEKGQAMIKQYFPKINDWRMSAEARGENEPNGVAANV